MYSKTRKNKIIPDPLPKRVFKYDDNINGYLQVFHALLYPEVSEYYWYREGLISHTDWTPKYGKALLWCFVTALGGSGTIMGLFVYAMHFMLETVHPYLGLADIDKDEPYYMELVSQLWVCLMMMTISGSLTVATYYYGATRLEQAYNFNPERQNDKEKWKCQPNRDLTDDLYQEQRRWGLANAFLAGFMGMGLFMRHLNSPFLKIYYDVSTRGWLNFWIGFLIVFFWVDLWAYSAHRVLHFKAIYKYIHKWHHRYKAPTAFSAFAMNPIEFATFQTGGILCCCMFPIHIMAFFSVVTYIAYHGQVDHSGIAIEGELPWVPSVYYHDDHHQYFHLNFGQNLILWDWLLGTLRTKKRVYGEDIFEGEQDSKTKAH